jgi:hypothetical protein
MKKFEVNYFNNGAWSHKYDETWEETEYFCPCCGKKAVWHEDDPGDYYVGEQFLCIACGASFYLPNGAEPSQNNEQDRQRLERLRDTSNPTGQRTGGAQ